MVISKKLAYLGECFLIFTNSVIVFDNNVIVFDRLSISKIFIILYCLRQMEEKIFYCNYKGYFF